MQKNLKVFLRNESRIALINQGDTGKKFTELVSGMI